MLHGRCAQDPATTSDCDIDQLTIDMLPDFVLLELFNFYANQAGSIEKWHTLVHACRRWRNVVFRSPQRLGLQLFCTAGKPVKEKLDVWPPLPLVIRHNLYPVSGMDNIIAALKITNRVREIRLCPVPLSFPMRSWAGLHHAYDLFGFSIYGIAETSVVCHRSCQDFPSKNTHPGYISPKAMVACLSTLASLAELELSRTSPLSRPNRESRRPPPLRRSVLPALRHFRFVGASGCLEDLVARIDSTLLDGFKILSSTDI